MIRFRMLLLVLLAAWPPLTQEAPEKKAAATPKAVSWESSVEKAFAKAAETKKPVLFVIMKDGEIACRRMMSRVWTNPRVVAKASEFVLLPCSTYMHVPIEREIGGKKVKTCPQFPGVSCAEHQAIEKEMRTSYQSKSSVVAPQHIFCDPDGEVLVRKEYELKVKGLLDLMAAAQARMRGEEVADAGEGAEEAAEGDKKPEAAKPPVDEAALAAAREKLLQTVITGPLEAKIEAAQTIARAEDEEAHRRLVEVLAGKDIKKAKERAEIVRALGYEEYRPQAKELLALLQTKNKHLRNCTVVTLEEMADPVAMPALLELWKKERDAEIKKDIIRALGPAGGQDPKALALVREQASRGKDKFRTAAAIALGSWLGSEDSVREDLKRIYRKAGNGSHGKVAVMFTYYVSGSEEVAEDVDVMLKGERHNDMKVLGGIVKSRLTGEMPDFSGGGRGGRGGRGAWRAMRVAPQMVRKLFAADKIQRHAIDDLLGLFNRGGRGGRGGRRGRGNDDG